MGGSGLSLGHLYDLPCMVNTGTYLQRRAVYTAFTLGCALAPSFASLIVFRLFVGVGASAPISIVGGIYADIYADPTTRGRAMTAFMAGAYGSGISMPTLADP